MSFTLYNSLILFATCLHRDVCSKTKKLCQSAAATR